MQRAGTLHRGRWCANICMNHVEIQNTNVMYENPKP